MRKNLLGNTALLTVSSLVMSAIGMGFQSWLAGRLGAAGIGLCQLVLSVTGLGATVAISGIRFASTRLVAEELGLERMGGVRAAMGRCLAYAAVCGTAAGLALWCLAPVIGGRWIGDARTVPSVQIAALSMPCVSLCAAVSGYFTACGRLWKPTLIHLAEELLGVGLVALFLRQAGDLEKSCAAVSLGRLAADFIAVFLMLAAYAFDRQSAPDAEAPGAGLTGRMLKIAVPLAVSAYARSALTTLRHLLVPRGLRASGFSAGSALAGYGTIQGMALPVIFFPACLVAAAAELTVPALTAAQVRNDKAAIHRTAGTLLRLGGLYGAAVGLFLALTADALGQLLFQSREAGRYIRLLAPLVPFAYLDTCVDGCLKGLGGQVWCMGINVLDGVLGLVLTWRLLPKYGLAAYVGCFYATEIINLALSAWRLLLVLRPGERGAAGASRRCGAGWGKCACRAGKSAPSQSRP